MNHKRSLGLAGEYRVISELFLRGHMPKRLRSGPDIRLENGSLLEVKSAFHSSYSGDSEYLFKVGPLQIRDSDFFICWCVNDDTFYVIPAKKASSSICITNRKVYGRRRRYAVYKNAWHLLNTKVRRL